jgi:hypothetical protein
MRVKKRIQHMHNDERESERVKIVCASEREVHIAHITSMTDDEILIFPHRCARTRGRCVHNSPKTPSQATPHEQRADCVRERRTGSCAIYYFRKNVTTRSSAGCLYYERARERERERAFLVRSPGMMMVVV